jgi:hypothetical protein
MFQTPRVNNCQSLILYWTKLAFKIEGELKTFQDKAKTKTIHGHKARTAETFQGILHTKEEER